MLERKLLRLRYRLKCLIGDQPRRVVFMHIPKCGGTSVHRHFKTNFGNSRSGKIAMLDSMEGVLQKPAVIENARAAQYVSGHFGWNALEAIGQDAFRFTIVREPFERLKSLYLYSRTRTHTDHRILAKMFAAAKAMDFGSFCLTSDPELRALIDNAQTRTLAHDFYPFHTQDSVSLIRTAAANLWSLDFVVDTSDLDEAFLPLASRTDTRMVGRLHLNETPRNNGVGMSRQEFESDRRLYALIAQDLDLYEHTLNIIGRYGRNALAA